MQEYTVTFARSAKRELQGLPAQVAGRVLAKIESLAWQPRPPGCKKLRGPSKLWRVRVGEYRIVYEIDDEHRAVDIVIVRHCGEAYR